MNQELQTLSKQVDERLSEINSESMYILSQNDPDYIELAKLQIASQELLMVKSAIIELL